MNKKYEYREPEVRAVIQNSEDILTSSLDPTGNLGIVTDDWEGTEFTI